MVVSAHHTQPRNSIARAHKWLTVPPPPISFFPPTPFFFLLHLFSLFLPSPSLVLAPKVGTTDGDDEVAKKAAAFKTGEVANSTPLPTAKEADAANLPKGKGDTIAE